MQHGGDRGDGPDVIKVYSEKNARIYLRSTSYGDYDGQLFGSAESYDQLLDDTYSYNYLFSILLKKAGMESDTVKIQSKVGFVLPYYMEMVQEGYKTQTNDVTYTGDDSSEYSVSYYQYDYTDLIKGNYFDGLTLGSYADEARAYESFVREQYLSIPDTTRAYLNTIISEQGFDINDPHPMVFQGEKWGVYLRVFTAGKRDIILDIRQNGKTVSQSTEKGIQGQRFISLPTGDLAPGEYTLSIISGKDSISVPLRVIARP